MSQRLTVSQYVSNPLGQFYAAATGGASTSQITSYGKRYTLHTFTSSTDLTVNSDGYLDFLIIGAGGGAQGAGGGVESGGGGGAEPAFYFRQFVDAGTFPVVIGAGVSAWFGERSYITSPQSGLILFVGHGGGNGSYTSTQDTYGGSTGGDGRYNSGLGGPGYVRGGRNANRGGDSNANQGGGGGGAGGAGSAGGVSAGAGGAGIDISLWLGQSATTTYKCGGGGGAGTSGTGAAGSGNGAANTGGGANGSSGATTGYSGIVYVRSAPQ